MAIKTENLIVRVLDLPYKIRGYVREDSEGDYNIYINSHYSVEEQRKILAHELSHVSRGDFTNDLSILEAESAPPLAAYEELQA